MPNQRVLWKLALGCTLLAGGAAAAGGLSWRSSVASAFAEARHGDRLLLVDAYAEWCGWCRKLEREVFPDPAFVAVARDFVALRVDTEDGGEGSELAASYEAYSLPTLLVLEPSGALVGKLEGYSPAAEMAARLERLLARRARELDSYRRTLAGGDAESLRNAALDSWQRNDGARAAALFEKLLDTSTLPAREDAWTRFLLADSWRLAGEAEKARAAAAAAERALARAAGVEPDLGERLALLPFWIAEAAHECGRAAGALADFERRHPASRLLAEARRAMARLRADAGPRCT